MRFIILMVLLLGVAYHSRAQSATAPVDSIKKALAAHITEDSNRVSLLVKLTAAVFTSVPDEAMKYADEALNISEKIKWKKGLALSYKCRGGVNLILTNYTKALDDYQKALTYDPKESKLFEAIILNNIGIIYDELKQHDKALVNYKKYLAVSIELKNKETEAMALGNIGTIYQQSGNYDSALYYYTTALARTKEIGNKRLETNVLCTLSSIYKETGKNELAIEYAEQSIQMADSSGNLYVKAPALNNLAWAHLNLSHFDKAEAYNKQSLAVSKELNNIEWQYESWNVLYTNYEKQHKPALALEAYKNYILLRDSAVNDEKKQEITRKDMLFEAEKKEAVLNAEHAAQLTQQRTVRNAIIGGTAVLLVGGLLSFVFYKRKKDAVTKQNEAELKAAITNTEMKALRAQMNPHFIFNSLNSISDYIAKNDTMVAETYLTKFAKLMRLVLENSEKKEVPLTEDLKALELYMQLEALRLNNKFTYSIKVDDTIDQDTTVVPPLILQPFVENSIWHGIAKKQGNGHILIQIKKDGEMISCIVEDDGVGRKETDDVAALKDSSGRRSLGMKITKERIDMINTIKKTNAVVKLTDLAQGTRVEVQLPLESIF